MSINTDYEIHHQHMHAQTNQEINEQWNTTCTSDMIKHIEPDELWPEDENTNTIKCPKYTIKQEIEKMPPSQIQLWQKVEEKIQ